MMQSSGKYKARLFDAVRFQTPGGKDAVSFTWDLFEIGRRVTSTLTLLDSHGHPNVAAIHDTKQWARGWDGANLDWFAAQLNARQVFEVEVSITKGDVEWVFPTRREKVVPTTPPQRYSSATYSSPVVIKLVVDRELLAQVPERVQANAENARLLFESMTKKSDRDDANLVWTMMAAEIGPMQVDFTPEQWQQMFDKIRNLESKTFVYRKPRKA